MATIGSITISGGSKPDLTIPINKDQNLASEIQAILDANIPISYGFLSYSFDTDVSYINWQSIDIGSEVSIDFSGIYTILKKVTGDTVTKAVTTGGTYYAVPSDEEKKLVVNNSLQPPGSEVMFIDINTGGASNIQIGKSFFLNNVDAGFLFVLNNFLPIYRDVSFSSPIDSTIRITKLNNAIFASIYTENEIEDSEFRCIQPDFIGGVEEGSTYVLISAPEIPNGVRIYLNSGEFGYVKGEKCLIKLDAPLIAESEIWCYISTDSCNVESCKYVVGSVISGNAGCLSEDVNLPQGTLVGTFICLGVDYYAEEWDGYGNKVLGTLIQEDCIYCGGELPNCEEVP